METEKDKWLKNIMDSGKELQQLSAPNHVYRNILGAIEGPVYVKPAFNQRLILVAASVLLILNAAVFLTSRPVEKQATPAYTIDSYNLDLY